jgi:hypothetical protein
MNPEQWRYGLALGGDDSVPLIIASRRIASLCSASTQLVQAQRLR